MLAHEPVGVERVVWLGYLGVSLMNVIELREDQREYFARETRQPSARWRSKIN